MNRPTYHYRNLVSLLSSLGSTASHVCVVGLKGFVRCYQIAISPFAQPRCRFQPTCSHYALQALETHGLLTGGMLSLKRLAKCHPLTHGGVDLVPQPETDGSKD